MKWNCRLKSIKEIVKQVAVQAPTPVMVTFRDSHNAKQWINQRQRNGGLVLEKLRFNWDMPDRYVELLNFQLEVMNILETRAYEINNEERMPVIRDWLGLKGMLLTETFTQEKKEKCKTTKRLSSVLSNRFNLYHNWIILALQNQKCKEKEIHLPRTGWADYEQKELRVSTGTLTDD